MELGDVVMLKSGGPSMTVIAVNGRREVKCQWFDADKLPQVEFFPPEALAPCKEPSVP